MLFIALSELFVRLRYLASEQILVSIISLSGLFGPRSLPNSSDTQGQIIRHSITKQTVQIKCVLQTYLHQSGVRSSQTRSVRFCIYQCP